MEVPTATSLHDIYPEDVIEAQNKRWVQLLAKFNELYEETADFVSRSPGRVNIIGEVSPPSPTLLLLAAPKSTEANARLRCSTSTTPSTKSSLWP